MNKNIPQSCNGKQLIYSWDYCDCDGSILGAVVRYENKEGQKEVLPFFKKQDNTLHMGIDLAPRPLYGLNKLADHPHDKAVFVVEGEKCVTALHYLGCCAVTSIGGSNVADKSDWQPLNNFKKVIILPDNDEAGMQYANTVCNQLLMLPNPPKTEIIQISGLPDKGDIVDWIKLQFPKWDGYNPMDNNEAKNLKKSLNEVVRLAVSAIPAVIKTKGAAKTAETATDPWLKIEETETKINVMQEAYPVEALPETVRLAVEEVTGHAQCPISMAASSALTTLSLAIQGYVDVKRDSKLIGPTSLYFLILADSGERKTSVSNVFLKPIVEFEREHKEQHQQDKKDYEAKLAIWEAKSKALKIRLSS